MPYKSSRFDISLLQLTSEYITVKIGNMKIVRVIYTTTQQYAATNKENIQAIVNELKTLNHPGIKYSTYLLPDGKTFMHFDQFENEEAHDVLTSLASFKKFASELEAGGLEVEPVLVLPSLVASTEEFFG